MPSAAPLQIHPGRGRALPSFLPRSLPRSEGRLGWVPHGVTLTQLPDCIPVGTPLRQEVAEARRVAKRGLGWGWRPGRRTEGLADLLWLLSRF